MAVSLLKSAVATKIITKIDMEDFLKSIKTIGHDLTIDILSTAKGQMKWNDFQMKLFQCQLLILKAILS